MTDTIYPVGLVGEQFNQGAISACAAGETTFVCHEVDNPHDDKALAVVTTSAKLIGYIPRDSFVRRAVFDEGLGTASRIKVIETREDEVQHVVLDVLLTEGPVHKARGKKFG